MFRQQHLAYRVFDDALYGTAQGSCSVLHVIALGGYLSDGVVREFQSIAHLGNATQQGFQFYVCNASDVLARKLVEVHYIVQTVQELRCELFLQCLLHDGSCLLFPVLVGGAVLETDACAEVLYLPGTGVAGHYDDGVAEVYCRTVAVRQPSFVHHLQEYVEHIGMCLFYLVQKHYGIGFAPYALGQLAALLVAHIARRRTHHPAYGVLLAILTHVYAYQRCLAAEHLHGQALCQVGLAHTRRPHEQEGANGTVGVFQAHTAALYGTCDFLHRLVLSHHALLQVLLQLAQADVFLVAYAVGRYAGHYAHHLCHGFCRNLCAVLLLLFHPCTLELFQLFGLHLEFVAEVGRRFIVLRLDGQVLPLLYVAQFRLQIVYLHIGGNVEYVHTCTALVHGVYGLVGEGTVADISLGQPYTCVQCLVGVLYLVVLFIGRSQAVQYLQGFLCCGLCHYDFLETSVQGTILFYGLAELVYRRCAYALHLPARQCRLQHVGGIHTALRTSGTDYGVYLVYVYDDIRVVFKFQEEIAHTLFKLSPELRACHHAGHVQRQYALAPELACYLALHYPLCQSLYYGTLSHTGFADEDWIVLLPARQDLGNTLHLLLASYHGIQFALARLCRQVGAEIVQNGSPALCRLLLGQCRGVVLYGTACFKGILSVLCILLVHLAVSALHVTIYIFARKAVLLQKLLYRAALVLEHSLEQMLRIHLLGMLGTRLQYAQAHQPCCIAVQFHAVPVRHHGNLLFPRHLLQVPFQRKQVGLYLMHHARSLTDILSQNPQQQMFG